MKRREEEERLRRSREGSKRSREGLRKRRGGEGKRKIDKEGLGWKKRREKG